MQDMTYHSDILIIQGDTCQINVEVEGVEKEFIEEVYLSCEKLNLVRALTYDQTIEKYVLVLSSEETKNFTPIITNFDITVKIVGNKIATGLYKGKIIIAEKNNSISEVNANADET